MEALMLGNFATAPFARGLSAVFLAALLAQGSGAVVAQTQPASLHHGALGADFGTALRAALRDEGLAAIYAARGDAPIWLAGSGAAAEALLDALRAAEDHALPAARYGVEALEAKLAGPRTGALEAALTQAYVRYARDVSSGVLEPRRVARLIKVDPPRRSPDALLAAAAAAPDMAAHLAALPPADPGYRALQEAYAALRVAAERAEWGAEVPAGSTLRPGDRGARVLALRKRLAALGEPSGDPAEPALFDATLERALRGFQRRSGLIDDGVVGPATLAAVNAPEAFRAGQIAVNLERMRWNNKPFGRRNIVVNIPDFSVTLSEDGRTLFHERVVVGRLAEQTPEFSDQMRHLVFNPTWHVPRSIATQDLLPALQRDPTVLAQRNMRLIRVDGGPVPADPSAHDFTAYTARDFPYRIRQAPSTSNALGLVKFMFPNADNIYLHDTPQKNLFDRDVRAFSWGCVRVRDPMRLAALLLAPQSDAPEAFIERILAAGRERYVHLDVTVPVHLVYRTAWVDEAGVLQLRGDVYGRDAAALEALRALGLETPGA
jgi:murein L,D-transpeptidase YcbB/YkuD